MFEIPLIDGKTILLNVDPKSIYDVVEVKRTKFKFTKRYPFFDIESKACVSFKMMDTYINSRSMDDSEYDTDLTMAEFCNMLGINYISAKEIKSGNLFKNGDVNG